MEFIKNLPGFQSKNGYCKLAAAIYYSICLGLIISYKMDIKLIIFILLPFIYSISKSIVEKKEINIVEKLKLYGVILLSIFVVNTTITVISNVVLAVKGLEKAKINIESKYFNIEKENKQITDNILNSEEFQNKIKEIENEKERIKKENKLLIIEKEYLEKKLK